jgi:4-hydroxy-2-oxoheptanedioate aldolase
MIPMIETSGEAKDAVAACRYPPRGKRGWAAGVARASLYGLDYDYTLQTADRLVVVCQIESVKAIDKHRRNMRSGRYRRDFHWS